VKAAIIGLGEWRPSAIRANDAWPADFAARAAISADRELAEISAGTRGDLCDEIVKRYVAAEAHDPFLGTTRRRVAEDAITSCEAEARAARAALLDSGVDASDVDFVCSSALTPDMAAQGNAPRVAHLVGASRALALTVDAACASAPVQLNLAAALIESGRARIVLLTQSHLATRIFPLAHPASPNVGDVATAMVVGPSEQPGVLSFYGVSHGEFYEAVVWRRSRAEQDTPWYQAGGPSCLGSRDPPTARRLIRETVRFGAETVTEVVRRAGVDVSSVDVLASVQPRRWVPGAIAEAVGLPPEIAPQTFDELAHLGQCGVVANLLEARRCGMLRSRPGKGPLTVCIYAQGMGFTRAAMLIRWAM
jgi:3-oxoacyl-[acyl-carrier-protein] synthase-3